MSFYKIILICSSILLFSCNTDQNNVLEETFSNASIAEKYLTDYSPRYISVKDGIVLKFKNEYGDDKVMTELTAHPDDLMPSLCQ